jgi:hypothetical protein
MLVLSRELFNDHELCHMDTTQLGVYETEILGRWDIGILALTGCETLNRVGDFMLRPPDAICSFSMDRWVMR